MINHLYFTIMVRHCIIGRLMCSLICAWTCRREAQRASTGEKAWQSYMWIYTASVCVRMHVPLISSPLSGLRKYNMHESTKTPQTESFRRLETLPSVAKVVRWKERCLLHERSRMDEKKAQTHNRKQTNNKTEDKRTSSSAKCTAQNEQRNRETQPLT